MCNHGWTQDAAATACQQLGYVLNPEDWDLEPGQIPAEGQTARILLRLALIFFFFFFKCINATWVSKDFSVHCGVYILPCK